MIGKGDGFQESYYVEAYRMFRDGLSMEEACHRFGCTQATFDQWRKKYPDFDQAINLGVDHRKKDSSKAAKELGDLTPKQFKFVEAYLRDLNVHDAVREAGYSEKDLAATGRQLISEPKILNQITRRAAEIRSRTEVSKERVIKELATIAFSNPQEFFDAEGNLRDITSMPESIARCISSIEIDAKEGEAGTVTTTAKIKMWDKVKGLELLARHLLLISNSKPVEQHLHLHQRDNPYDGASAQDLLKVRMLLEDLKKGNGNGHDMIETEDD